MLGVWVQGAVAGRVPLSRTGGGGYRRLGWRSRIWRPFHLGEVVSEIRNWSGFSTGVQPELMQEIRWGMSRIRCSDNGDGCVVDSWGQPMSEF